MRQRLTSLEIEQIIVADGGGDELAWFLLEDVVTVCT